MIRYRIFYRPAHLITAAKMDTGSLTGILLNTGKKSGSNYKKGSLAGALSGRNRMTGQDYIEQSENVWPESENNRPEVWREYSTRLAILAVAAGLQEILEELRGRE